MKNKTFILLFILLTIALSLIIGMILDPNNFGIKIGVDTWGHLIGFFALTWLLHGVFKIELTNTCICLIFYGAFSELGQLYLGFRNGEFLDFFADVAGILLFTAAKWGYIMYDRSQYKQKTKRRI